MGGLGKTTIAKEIFYAEDLLNYFSERIWVTVSERVSEPNIFLSILKQLRIYDCEPDINVMLPRIREALANKNCLIVIDDVWDMDYDWWRQIFNEFTGKDNCAKCLIITTRNENVLKNLGVTRIHRPQLLDETESMCLFSEVFSAYNNFSSDSEFRRAGEDIVKKCHGLPLAIKTIAGLLSTKPLSLQKWKDVCDNFHDGLETVNISLQLSYDDLSSMMKQCLLCFSIYPDDAEISAEQLVYWWVGEGIVHGSTRKTALEVGEQCLYELVNRCLVEVAHQRRYDGRVYQCKMHDMVRNFIIQKSKAEAFGSFDEEGKNRPAEDARHLGYTNEMDEMLPGKSSKLRAFLLMKNCIFRFPQNIVTMLASVKSLRVLDLSHNEQDISAELLLKLIKSHKRLAYLNLHKIRGLEELPDWIRKRQNLQILIITECRDLKTLHPSITILKNLVVLKVENCSLQNLPRGLWRLTKLQVLSGFKLACSGNDGARLDELIGLKKLRELRISLKKNDEISDDEAHALLKLDQLKVLSIDTKDCDRKQFAIVNKLLPPPSLRELFLRSYLGNTTPTWLSPSRLPELVYLYIDQSLYLRWVSQSFWDTNGRIRPWRIEGLCFKHLSRFELDWDDVCSKMEHLSYVEVSHCYAFKDFPCDVNIWDSWEKPQF
ncbi:Disease resistance protein [Thalictrum thalictroides]|uniref:Disease resistance protein n=1 Tax=Thalictrum thalictroides TaxID=46969 RepID=A0A7J6VB68_THATH|nr:Disease resistance protein [Thalictrum thalictroides]